MARSESRRGTALVATMVVFAALSGLLVAMSTLSAVELRDSRAEYDELRAGYLAEAGYERGVRLLETAIDNFDAAGPLVGLQSLFAGGAITPYAGVPLTSGDGAGIGEYTVTMTEVARTDTSITV